jgi:hypothetical protein
MRNIVQSLIRTMNSSRLIRAFLNKMLRILIIGTMKM